MSKCYLFNMFNINIRRLYYVCTKTPIRNLRSRSQNFRDRNPNPGLSNRLQAFKEDGVRINPEDAEEIMEQSDSNFYDVGQSYNEHLNETLMGKHELRHHIVKAKYFKENMPNLLTWSEKEQIRHLATTQPDEWTPQKLAESFPVTESVAKKLLKYPWKPASAQRIARHDASAMRNWRELKEGTLDIPEDLRQYYLKFSDRTIPPLNKKSVKEDLSVKKIGEFEQIVTKCAINEQKKEKYEEENKEHISTEEEKVNQPMKDHTRVTLDELARKIRNRLEHGNEVNLNDHIIMDSISTLKTETQNNVSLNKEIALISEDPEKNLTVINKSDEVVVDNYPERIRVPKQAYKRGATYKVNDCFYDDDGRFLYRVMGMN